MGQWKIVDPLILIAVTPVHAGTGRSLSGDVDLPVQRDWRGIPIIWGSSIKGAMRSLYSSRKGQPSSTEDREEESIFGPRRERAADHASAISIWDARLLLIPAPCSPGGFCFVTTPLMLRECALLLDSTTATPVSPETLRALAEATEQGERPAAAPELLKGGEVTKIMIRDRLFSDLSQLPSDRLAEIHEGLKSMGVPEGLARYVKTRMLVLPDEELSFVGKLTTVVVRVALTEKKTVESGALWTEEYVPELSMFLTAITFTSPKGGEGGSVSPEAIREKLYGGLGASQAGHLFLTLGGNETVGKGLV
ncbi:MAG: type III-B CRISPR module RAMP protein Cmr4, partial [Candidatus Korarchaeota archaeon]|nr:type III-B CRISPR module RAMP protein Cmr4 [Candidatus Korarchaeota archaeon]